ncbi:MAG: prephenate dehydrogenase [Bacillales bacterium]|jgi:prephenate dehydrogenase|nr:prephenate dehydrogenase [Bacillales bacterium]
MVDILIVGLGVIGGSLAKRLSLSNNIYGLDINKHSLDLAYKEGIIKNNSNDVKELIQKSDTIIVCLSAPQTLKWVQENKMFFNSKQLIIDVFGVKGFYYPLLKEELIGFKYASIHPMSGNENSGYEYSKDDVFINGNMLVIENEYQEELNVLFNLLGVNKVSIMNVDEHDKKIAYLSGLPHAVSVSLLNIEKDTDLKRFSGPSFNDMTRIGYINSDLWSSLFLENAYLPEYLLKLEKELRRMRKLIQNKDISKIKKKLDSSRKKRKKFNDNK